ncbi:RNA polymerase sigma-70 factor (ECF subfamily) [Desulfohalotomaculum tongense]|uniref:RNA polymerase sigma factor n=1 Tax=Desulforadius tongensis TaxID=1216062 RepID=UPI00195B43AF|nr:RNA polymerase sigma factor [Desulforadius tongensis]MBM7854241.1 RNA polymerase sigma-70 factor (ECF subfamily) [Desulforadius tongensis]
MDELEIILRSKAGDLEAFEDLYKLYSPQALRTVYLMTYNKELSEDIVQEAFVECFNNLKNIKNPRAFKSWLYKILKRICWRYSNKEKKLIPMENIFDKYQDNRSQKNLSESIEQSETRMFMLELLNKLSLPLKTTMILYYYNEMSVSEIAKVLGCFEGTVKSRLHKARKQIEREILKTNEQFYVQEVLGKGWIKNEKPETI